MSTQTTSLMTRAETAVYAKCAAITVYRAWELYRRTGQSGLRGSQPSGPNGRVLFDPQDVDRWLAGESPRSQGRRSA